MNFKYAALQERLLRHGRVEVIFKELTPVARGKRRFIVFDEVQRVTRAMYKFAHKRNLRIKYRFYKDQKKLVITSA